MGGILTCLVFFGDCCAVMLDPVGERSLDSSVCGRNFLGGGWPGRYLQEYMTCLTISKKP
jgi:hypothetical protein